MLINYVKMMNQSKICFHQFVNHLRNDLNVFGCQLPNYHLLLKLLILLIPIIRYKKLCKCSLEIVCNETYYAFLHCYYKNVIFHLTIATT